MSASNLPQDSLEQREHHSQPQQRSQQRRWLGIFPRRNHYVPPVAENERDVSLAAVEENGMQPEVEPGQPDLSTLLAEVDSDTHAANHAASNHELAHPEVTPLASVEDMNQANSEATLPEQTGEDELLTTLTAEVETLRAQLAERDAALQAQLNIGAEQRALLEALRASNETLETELHMAQAKIEQMSLDQQNLQAALTASIQHAAEQQDSLLRWQELAESADECVTGLEKQISVLQQALHECNDQRESLHQEYEETSQALAQAQAQLESLSHHQEIVTQLTEARQRINELEETLEEDAEKLTWYKLSLANSRNALVRAGLQLGEQERALQTARAELSSREQTIGRSRATFARLAASLQLKHENEKKLQAKLEKLTKQIHEERARWYKTLKRHEQQLAATEGELEHFWQGYRAQGQRLADVQAALLDREQALAESRTRLQQQTQLLQWMRQAADERITQLEESLAQAEQQIRDLKLVVERRAKREAANNNQ